MGRATKPTSRAEPLEPAVDPGLLLTVLVVLKLAGVYVLQFEDWSLVVVLAAWAMLRDICF